jgi:hypothetical protein
MGKSAITLREWTEFSNPALAQGKMPHPPREIIKIGITTGSVEARINQLYTTGVPFRFRIIKTVETKNYDGLEQALHSLLAPYRITRSREFFTDECLPHLEHIISIHDGIQRTA